jgi:hypothetical protein
MGGPALRNESERADRLFLSANVDAEIDTSFDTDAKIRALK